MNNDGSFLRTALGRHRAVVVALSIATILGAAGPARAGSATMDRDFSAWGLLGYAYGAGEGYGLGVRYQTVIVPQGLIHGSHVRDEVGLEFGADWVHYSWNYFSYQWTYDEVAPVLGVVWNFWLNDKMALYPKVDVGYRFGSWSDNVGLVSPGGYGGALLEGAAGVVYRLDRVALRAEAGTYGLRLGAAFTF